MIYDSQETKMAVASLEEMIADAVDISFSEEAVEVDEQVLSERYGDKYTKGDGGGGNPIIFKAAVLKEIDGFDLAVSSAAVEAMMGILGDDGDKVVPVRRSEEPIPNGTKR